MKQMIAPGALPAAWDPQAMYDKAERYIQQAQAVDKEGWDYALWTSLSLELLARAALSNLHPALLADHSQTGSNLFSALGFVPIEKRFSPKSITISEVLKRLAALLPDFTTEHESFGVRHTGKRNAELHSGEMAFDVEKVAAWQHRFYSVCSVLLASMGMTLVDFVGNEESLAATELMEAAADDSAKAVKGDVEAHAKVWQSKDKDERANLVAQAEVWATRQEGHRAGCPACGSVALVFGKPVAAAKRNLDDDTIVEKQEHLPTHFECIACGLKINSLSRLTVVGLDDRYTSTQVYDAAQFYAPPEDEWPEYEDDNNER